MKFDSFSSLTTIKEHVKERKGMKFMSALTMALPMFLGTGVKVFADAPSGYKYHDSLPQQVIYPTSENLTKSYASFNCRLVYKGGIIQSDPGIAAIWQSDQGDQMFCTEPYMKTPHGTYTNATYKQTDPYMVAVLRAGWPCRSSQELGLGNDTVAAFYATQLAVWTAHAHDKTASTQIMPETINWRSPNGTATQAECLAVRHAYEKILSDARVMQSERPISTIELQSVGDTDESDVETQGKWSSSKTFRVITKNENRKPEAVTAKFTISATAVPGTTKVWQDGKLVGQGTADSSGNLTITGNIKTNDTITIETPTEDHQAMVNVSVSSQKVYELVGMGVSGNYAQHEQSSMGLIALKSQPITASKPYSFKGHPIKIIVHKKDNREKEGNALAGVTFKLYRAATQAKDKKDLGSYIGSYTTDQDGSFSTAGLPYGYYVLVEDSVPKNIKIDRTHKPIDATYKSLQQTNGVLHVDYGSITNQYKDVNVTSTATNLEDGSKYAQPIQGPVVINENLHFSHLQTVAPYKVHAWLVDQETGQPIMINGKKIEVTKDFGSKTQDSNPDGLEQDLAVQLKIPNASSLAGKNVVVFCEGEETESTTDGKKYDYVHKDLNDKTETVHFTKPSLHTKALNKETGSNILQPTDGEKLVDTVIYKELIPGKTYTIKGIVVDKETGKAVLNNGKKVIFTKTFTANDSNGEVNAEVTFDDHHYWNHDLVVYETIYYTTYELAKHRDINAPSQTMHVSHPRMHSTLAYNGQKLVYASARNVVEDVIRYVDLIPGTEYTIRGQLMDQVTGLPVVKDGMPIIATARFTPNRPNGTITVDFKFNGKPYVGHNLVAFETIYADGRVVLEHADLNDASESILVDHYKRHPFIPYIIPRPQPHNSEIIVINNNNNNNNNSSNNNSSNNGNNSNSSDSSDTIHHGRHVRHLLHHRGILHPSTVNIISKSANIGSGNSDGGNNTATNTSTPNTVSKSDTNDSGNSTTGSGSGSDNTMPHTISNSGNTGSTNTDSYSDGSYGKGSRINPSAPYVAIPFVSPFGIPFSTPFGIPGSNHSTTGSDSTMPYTISHSGDTGSTNTDSYLDGGYDKDSRINHSAPYISSPLVPFGTLVPLGILGMNDSSDATTGSNNSMPHTIKQSGNTGSTNADAYSDGSYGKDSRSNNSNPNTVNQFGTNNSNNAPADSNASLAHKAINKAYKILPNKIDTSDDNTALPQTGSENNPLADLIGIGFVTVVASAAVEFINGKDKNAKAMK